MMAQLLQLGVLSVFLPTYDSYMDLYISGVAILNGHYKWGCAMLAPVLLNLAFTTHAWWRMDSKSEKKWTWLLLLTLSWPQWRACKVIYTLIVRGKEQGLKDKEEQCEKKICSVGV